MAFTLVLLTSPSSADVTAVSGRALGATGTVSFFGSPPFTLEPIPDVTLPPGGGQVSDSVPSIFFQVGPAPVLVTGRATVTSAGSPGPNGSVTSTATVQNPRIGESTYALLSARCTASESGVSGSTTAVGGRVPVEDPNPAVEGDEVYVDVPTNPAPNTLIRGVVPGLGDQYDAIFNEQTVTEDGITVTALHVHLLGPSAVGDVYIGQVHCGVSTAPVSTTTTTTTAPPVACNPPTGDLSGFLFNLGPTLPLDFRQAVRDLAISLCLRGF